MKAWDTVKLSKCLFFLSSLYIFQGTDYPDADGRREAAWGMPNVLLAHSLAARNPAEPTTCPAACEATAQENTVKANKNRKVIAYLLFPRMDTFPKQAPGIWRLFWLTTESFYLLDSPYANWQADPRQGCRCGLLTLRVIRFPPVCFPPQHFVALPIKG